MEFCHAWRNLEADSTHHSTPHQRQRGGILLEHQPLNLVSATGQRLEYPGEPLVFLHEGLGSVDLWRDFPQAVVTGTGQPGFVYSRYGNGWSTPLDRSHQLDYMHREALDTLPEIIDCLESGPPILIGHSDGASIALVYAGSGYPVGGLVLIAPHVFVEPETVRSIAAMVGIMAPSMNAIYFAV